MSYLSQISDKVSNPKQLDEIKSGIQKHESQLTEAHMIAVNGFYATAERNLKWINTNVPSLHEFLVNYSGFGIRNQLSWILIGICVIINFRLFQNCKISN